MISSILKGLKIHDERDMVVEYIEDKVLFKIGEEKIVSFDKRENIFSDCFGYLELMKKGSMEAVEGMKQLVKEEVKEKDEEEEHEKEKDKRRILIRKYLFLINKGIEYVLALGGHEDYKNALNYFLSYIHMLFANYIIL